MFGERFIPIWSGFASHFWREVKGKVDSGEGVVLKGGNELFVLIVFRGFLCLRAWNWMRELKSVK